MAKAAVLKDGRIIQTTNLTKKRFDLLGFLVEFTVKDRTYVVGDINDLHENDRDYSTETSAPQYYEREAFLQYLANKKYLVNLFAEDRLKSTEITLATSLDEVTVLRLHLTSPSFTDFGDVEIYTVSKDNIIVKDNKGSKEIIFPDTIQPVIKLIPNLHPSASLFFQARTDYITNISDLTERKENAFTIANIALMIHVINRDVFNVVFKDSGQDVKDFISAQNNDWAVGHILDNPNLSDLRAYYRALAAFYRDTYSNQIQITNAGVDEQLFWLASVLSPAALVVLPIKFKINLLLFMVKRLTTNWEHEKDETLVIRIILSFNEVNLAESGQLLDALHDQKPDVNNNISLYQLLYERMSTSTNFVEGLFALNNWVFGTAYKPNQTKGQFVQAVYAIWQYSKYNPYTENGDIKPKTIGIKALKPTLASFSPHDPSDNTGMLYYYSHMAAYEAVQYETHPDYTGPQLYTYKQVLDDAAPIVMPYESEKTLGIYFDNFNFKFSGTKMLAYQSLPTGYHYATYEMQIYYNQPLPDNNNVLYGKYDIFQPVSLLNTNREAKVPIVTTDGNPVNLDGKNINSFIPLFVLEYIDNAADRSNVETLIGYAVDIASTLTGIGNLTKLRHLKWAAAGAEEIGLWSIEGLHVVVGAVDFSSGVLSFLTNFAECDENDSFCKGMKSFLDALQIATLSINSIDSLATWTAKMKARLVVKQASNATEEAAMTADLATAFGGGSQAEEAATAIVKFADLASQFDEFLKHAKSVRELVVAKINRAKDFVTDATKVGFKLEYLTDDIQQVVQHLSTKVNYAGQLLDQLAADFVFIASKTGKAISKEELIKQIDFFYEEVLKRKFPSGFAELQDYRNFCNKTRNFLSGRIKFWDVAMLKEINWESLGISRSYVYEKWVNFDFNERVELIVQGSANRKYLDGDPLLHMPAAGLPSGNPGDFEFALRMSDLDFQIYMQLAIHNYQRYYISLGTSLKKGFVIGGNIAKLDDKIFVDFQAIIEADIRFPASEVTFSIVQAGGAYDLQPNLIFQY